MGDVDYNNLGIICANSHCPRKEECYRYARYQYIKMHKIVGVTCTILCHEACQYFIEQKDNLEMVILQHKRALEEELDRMVNVIKEKYDPEKIILLGSVATGIIHEDSNIDLIIIKDTNKDFDTRLKEIKSMNLPTLLGHMMVFTPTEFKIREANGRFQKYYLAQSKVLFEKR